ncbi:MAG: hypothetical protein Q4B47_05155 [Eubacteriales bacterium]|nr:hypothetical protein [Eubacteriales bacterium]
MLNELIHKAIEMQDELSEEEKKTLRRRIRPAMQLLIDEENLTGLRKISEYGYYGAAEMDVFISYAKSGERKLALLWLLNEKEARFGFKDRSFEF